MQLSDLFMQSDVKSRVYSDLILKFCLAGEKAERTGQKPRKRGDREKNYEPENIRTKFNYYNSPFVQFQC